MTKAEMEFREGLTGTGIVAPVRSSAKAGRLEVLCRQIPGVREDVMIDFITKLLHEAETGSLNLHVCKRFILKDGKTAFGWNFALDMPSLKGIQAAVIILKAMLEKFEPTLSAGPAPQAQPAKNAPAPVRISMDPADLRKNGVVVDGEVDKVIGVSAGIIGNMRPVSGTYPQGGAQEGKLTVSAIETDEDGSRRIIYSMPLPHVTKSLNELNAPKHPDGAGATKYGRRTFDFHRRATTGGDDG